MLAGTDLALTKTNNQGGNVPLSSPTWTWTIQLKNIGDAATSFSNPGTVLIHDGLPNTNVVYSNMVASNDAGVSGSYSCTNSASTVVCSVPSGTVTFQPGGTLTVTIDATASAAGAYSNPRAGNSCYVEFYQGTGGDSDSSNNACSDSVTVTATAADLSITKSNDVAGQSTSGGSWTWTLVASNSAGAGSPATFATNQTILKDQLPEPMVSYGTVGVSEGGGTTGTINCSIASFDLTCTAGSGGVSIPASGTVTVTVPVTAGAELVYANPRGGGTCSVDPLDVVSEASEGNNNCSDSVTTQTADMSVTKTNDVGGTTSLSTPSWTWTFEVENVGTLDRTYQDADQVLHDALPNTNVSYGTPAVSNNAGVSGSLGCSITSFDLRCNSIGTTVFHNGGKATVTVQATATASGTYANPRSGGTCFTDAFSGSPDDVNFANNNCSDSVTVTAPAPDLSIVKTNDVGGQSLSGGSWTWTLLATNSAGAGAAATFADGQTILSDNLPNVSAVYGTPNVTLGGGTTGSVDCSVVGFDLTCQASGSVSMPPGGTVSVTLPTMASAELLYANPRSGGQCAVDPSDVVSESSEVNNSCSDSVDSRIADMTVTKTNDVGGVQPFSTPTWTWTLDLENIGTLSKTYSNNDQVLFDHLPDTNISYGTPGVSLNGGVSGSVVCQIAAFDLACKASGAVVFASGGKATITVTSTASTPGVYANPRSASGCFTNGLNGSPADGDLSNNNCADTVTVESLPDLTVAKTNSTGGVSTAANWTWTWTIGNAAATETATFANLDEILEDNLPDANVTYGAPQVVLAGGAAGTVNCAVASSDLTCTASGAVTIPAGATITVTVLVNPTGQLIYANPRSGGACAVDPLSSVAESDDANNACADTVVVPSTATTTITAAPSMIPADGASVSTITVQAKDANGDPITTSAGTVTLQRLPALGVLSAVTDNGDGTYTATLTAGTVAGSVTITGTLNGNPITDDEIVVLEPGPATTLLVDAPAAAAGGSPFDVTLTARDANGNTATGYAGTVHFTSDAASATLPTDYAFDGGDAGVHLFSATLNSAGDISLTATDTVTSSIHGSDTVAVTGDTMTSLISSSPTSVVGQSVTFTATVSSTTTGTITGTVTFKDGVDTIGTGAVSGGEATFATSSLAEGEHSITAEYGATSPFTGSTSAPVTQTVNVFTYDPPTVTKSFTNSTIVEGGTSMLTITLANANADPLTSAAFTDTYPSGVVNGSPANGTTTCGGTVTAADGGSSVALSGGTIPASGNCTVTVIVTAATSGIYTNSIGAGALTTSEAAANTAPAAADLMVTGPPTIAKAFSPSDMPPDATSTLTVTLTNPNASAATSSAFTDTYPSGITNAASPAAATDCGGTATATAGGNTLSLSGGTIPAFGSCTVTVLVTGATPGDYANTIDAGALTTSEGANSVAAIATLGINAPPIVTKAFNPPTIGVGLVSTLTITLTNPNTASITGVAFTDTYLGSLVNAATPAAATTCGGTVTAAAGGGSVALSGGTIPPTSSCTVTVNVTSNTTGAYGNVLAAGSVTTDNAGSNSAAGAATLNVSSDVPTLSGLALLLLAAFLGVIAAVVLRR